MKHSTLAIIVCALLAPLSVLNAESVVFTVDFPQVKESWMLRGPDRSMKLTVHPFKGNVEYRTRVVNVETGQVVPSGSTVPQGTKLRFEFSGESMSWFTTSSLYDTPYAYWTQTLPPALACNDADLIHDSRGCMYKGKSCGTAIFAPIYGVPPEKGVQNTSLVGPCIPLANGNVECTATNIGTHALNFSFAQSKAEQYYRIISTATVPVAGPPNRWPRLHQCEPLGDLNGITDLVGAQTNEPRTVVTLPTQTIPYTVTVGDAPPPIDGPQQPSISAAGNSCVVGNSFAVRMSATHTQNKQLRFLIDWNDDGTTDQVIPSSGYVAPGIEQTASRTYATPGAHSLSVRAQDEDGALSSWASFSFSCASASETTGLIGDNPANPGDTNGVSGSSVLDLSIRAIPSLIRPGNTTKVHWNSQNMTSCNVTGTNGDAWSGNTSPTDGEISSIINNPVKYTLTCRGIGGTMHTKQATVNILPIWTER